MFGCEDTERKRQREKERDKGRARERKRERERRAACLQFFNTASPSFCGIMVFDVVKLESMLRYALDRVSQLEMMLVTACARVRRNETSFSWSLLVPRVWSHTSFRGWGWLAQDTTRFLLSHRSARGRDR